MYSICFCLSDPIDDTLKSFQSRNPALNKFQTTVLLAPFADFPTSCIWCALQSNPFTSCYAQYSLRYKVLDGDMSKYVCCRQSITLIFISYELNYTIEGYYSQANDDFLERDCPEFCLCLESAFCNPCAFNATRYYAMDKFNLQYDPCDFRFIRFYNCMRGIGAIFDFALLMLSSLSEDGGGDGDNDAACIYRLIDTVSGCCFFACSPCMTAQVAYEINFQQLQKKKETIREINSKDKPQQVVYSQPVQQLQPQQPQPIIYSHVVYAQPVPSPPSLSPPPREEPSEVQPDQLPQQLQ